MTHAPKRDALERMKRERRWAGLFWAVGLAAAALAQLFAGCSPPEAARPERTEQAGL